MPSWLYFSRPSNLALHDLTTHDKAPANLRCLLGLNLKFIPRAKFTTSDMEESTNRFRQSAYLRDFYRNNPVDNSDKTHHDDFNPKLHIPTHWTPAPWKLSKNIITSTDLFTNSVDSKFIKRRSSPNLSTTQIYMLKQLMGKTRFVIAKADKNLGPCIIETEEYIRLAIRDHLSCQQTYQRLSKQSATIHMDMVRKNVGKFLYKHRKTLSQPAKKYIRTKTKECKDMFPKFYLLMKIHKQPLKTRPVVSCSGSLLHPLGVWLDDALQPIAQSLPSFIGSSYDLKEAIDDICILPPNARLFTADAVSMYTNIDTYRALHSIRNFLRRNPLFRRMPLDAIHDALDLIMNNNVFQFGDCFFRQLTGTAMGTPPACCYATIYYAIKESNLLERFSDNLLFYKRYIDDVFGIWVDNNPSLTFNDFKEALNFHQLRWEVNDPTTSVIFLDMEISIKENLIITKMYEKKLNLYLYISPHSAHPPGVLSGLVIGNILRIHYLCSEAQQRRQYYTMFFQRLRARGYLPAQLNRLFQRGFDLAATKPMPSTKNKKRLHSQHTNATAKMDDDSTIIYHVPYHPKNPPSHEIQQLFSSQFLQGRRMVSGINKLTIAYSRPHNLGECLSYRRIESFHCPPVSSFL